MEDITTKLDNISISNEKVLYYSIAFDNYKDIVKIVSETLSDNLKGIYTKTIDGCKSFDTLETKEITETFSPFIEKLKPNENFIVYDDKLYTLNSEFHITTLFTSGKPHEKSSEMEEQVGKKVNVKLNKLGLSHNFIVLGVEYIKLEDDTDINYYGNSVKHITIALNKTGKKVFPKDSYTALEKGKIFDLDIIIEGKCSKVVQ